MTQAEELAGWIDEGSCAKCRLCGGYPDDVGVVAGHVVVATVDEDEPALEIYGPEVVAAWHARVVAYRRKHRKADWWKVMVETMPEWAAGANGPRAATPLEDKP